jgi:hypothetical protein
MTWPGVRPDDEIFAKTPPLFRDSEAPAAGTTVLVTREWTGLIVVLTLPLSVLCEETVPAKANVRTPIQHMTIKILRFI